MDIFNHTNCNRDIGKPKNWDESKDGPCSSLPVQDVVSNGLPWMISYWKPSAEELKLLNEGKPVMLGINSVQHPVVFVGVDQ